MGMSHVIPGWEISREGARCVTSRSFHPAGATSCEPARWVSFTNSSVKLPSASSNFQLQRA